MNAVPSGLTSSICAFSNAFVSRRSVAVWPSTRLDIPSGEVKLNREFDVTSSSSMTMLLDFDGNQSIHQTGNGRYMMSPVVTILSVN